MSPSHGLPDLAREEATISELGAAIRRARKAVLLAVLGAACTVAGAATAAAADFAVSSSMNPTKALGLVFGASFFATLLGARRLAAMRLLRWAESRARALAKERRCDMETLVDAARVFASGNEPRR